jgi:DNA polymerase III epsilon subunit-like protein
MRVLVFDTETTGLPSKYNAKVEELNVWPFIVQFSWVVYDTDEMDILEIKDYIIKLKGEMLIPIESTKIHGITNKMMFDKGKSIEQVLYHFYEDLVNCSMIIAHNLKFDKSMVQVESIRNGIDFSFNEKVEFCTMIYGNKICNLTRINYKQKVVSKFPKLIELYEKLFNEVPNNLHNSLNDVLVCFRCFYKMRYNLDILQEDDKMSGFNCF